MCKSGNRQAREGVAAHHPSDPLEVLLEVLVTVAIAVRNCDAAVVCPQQRCHAQRQSPGKFSLHCHVHLQGLHCPKLQIACCIAFAGHDSSGVCAIAIAMRHDGATVAHPQQRCHQDSPACISSILHIQDPFFHVKGHCACCKAVVTCLICCPCHSQAQWSCCNCVAPASLPCTAAAAWAAHPAPPCKQPFEFRTCMAYTIQIQASTCML